MKDLDTSVQLPQLIEAGVHTLKIEGRKKDAQIRCSRRVPLPPTSRCDLWKTNGKTGQC